MSGRPYGRPSTQEEIMPDQPFAALDAPDNSVGGIFGRIVDYVGTAATARQEAKIAEQQQNQTPVPYNTTLQTVATTGAVSIPVVIGGVFVVGLVVYLLARKG